MHTQENTGTDFKHAPACCKRGVRPPSCSLLNNSGGQQDLEKYANAGDDDGGKNERRTDYPFYKPGFPICHIVSQGAHISRYLLFQKCDIGLCRQLR